MKKVFLSRQVGLLILAATSLSVLSTAQDRGGITGTITDQSGAGVPDASVKVINTARGESIELRSTTVGRYSPSNLRTSLPEATL